MGKINKQEKRILNQFIQVCGLLTVCLGLSATLGWIFDIPQLASFGASKIPMALSTAVLFIVYGLIIFFLKRLHSNQIIFRIEVVINCAGILFALLLLYLSLYGIRPEVEHLGIKMNGTIDGLIVGHMSPVTAFCFVLVGFSFLIMLTKPEQIKTSLIFAVLVFFISISLLLSYILGTPLLYEGSFIPPALTSSLAFLFIGIALLLISGLKVWSYEEFSDALSTRYIYTLAMVFIVLIISIITVGYSYYKHYEKQFRSEIEQQLSAVAELKVHQIMQWRKERFDDANIFYKNKAFSYLVTRYFQNKNDLTTKTQIKSWIKKLQQSLEADQVTLIDPHFNKQMIFPENEELNASFINKDTELKLRSGEIVFEDFYYNEKYKKIYLKIFVPILDEQEGIKLIGILTLRIDPQHYLYPLLKEWPTPTKTAETVLIRREGNDIVILNELRFRINTAFNLARRHLNEKSSPAVRAALGKKEFMETFDHFGVPVIAYVCPIPNSPWFLITRVAISEVYAPLREKFLAIIILVVGLLIGSGASVGLIWRHQRSKFYLERYQSTENIRRLNRVYAVLSNINEAIVRIRKPQDLFEKACEIAVEMGGFQMAWIGKTNLQTRKVDVVASKGVSEEYLNKIDFNYEGDESLLGIAGRVIKTGVHVISNDIQKDESILPPHKKSVMYGSKSFAAFPLIVYQEVWGVFKLYSREIGFFDKEELKLLDELAMDISFAIEFDEKEAESKQAKEALQESEQLFRGLFNASPTAINLMDPHDPNILWPIIDCNEATSLMNGFTREELIGHTIDVLNARQGSREESDDYYKKLKKEGIIHVDVVHRHKDGHLFPVEASTTAVTLGGREMVLGIDRDITERKRMEEALQENEKKYRELFDYAPIGYHELDSQGRIAWINRTELDMFGYTEEEMIGQYMWKFVEDENASQQRVLGKLNGIRPPANGQESVYRRKDLTTFPILVGEIILRDTTDKIIGIRTTVQDITEHKRAEAALRESEQLFRGLFNASPYAINLMDPHDPNILWPIIDCNEATCLMNGYTREELIGHTIDVINARQGSREESDDYFKKLKKKGIIHVDVVHRHKDGHLFPVEASATVVTLGGHEMVLGIDRDITERKQAEEEIILQKNKFAQLFDNSPVANALLDNQDKVININDSFTKLFGYFLEEIKGLPINELIVSPEFKEEALSISNETHRSNQINKESYRKKKDGTNIFVQIVGIPITINDKKIGVYSMYVDLTQRKDAEEKMKIAKELAEQSSKLKTEFLAQMSHEIRTPLNIILGNTDYLNNSFGEKMDSDVRDCFEGIDLASKRITRTVDLILNVAELQSSGYKPQLVKIDLDSEILSKLYKELELSAKQKGIELIYKNEIKKSEIIADEYSITQIFANLIDNAIKYTKKGKIEILLGKNKADNIIIEVKDTGIGMSNEFLPKLFDPFVQEEQGYVRSYDGNGLGLALVKNYCDINNASIEVESEKNVGSTFRVIFNRSK